MVKKILYSLLIFVSIFFLVDNVSAAYDNTNTIYLDLENSKVTTALSNLESKLNEIIDYYENNNPYNHKLVIYVFSSNNILVKLLPNNFVSTMGSNYCFIAFGDYPHGLYRYGCQTNIKIKNYTFTSSSDISEFKNDMLTEFSSISGTKVGFNASDLSFGSNFSDNFVDNKLDYFSKKLVIFPYYSDIPIYNYYHDTSGTYYKIQFGNTEIPFEGYLGPSNNYFGKKYEEYSLSSITYSAIEVKFNVDDLGMIDEGNDINLEYEINLQNEMILPLLPIPQEKVYRALALEDYILGTTVNLLFDEKDNSYSYEGTKHYDYWNTVTYRFEFPFLDDYIGNVNFKFWSDSPYTITLEERDSEDNDIKYTELDLTGKFGVGFIPKVVNFGMYKDFYGIFKVPMQNSYRLLFYKDYNYLIENVKTKLIEDITLLSFEQFEYLFTMNNKNSFLIFINNNFEKGTQSSIYYNSNYFNYCILDDSISTCKIINPNTDEEVIIPINLSDVDSFGISSIFDTFLSFSNSTNFILENVTYFYNNYLPNDLKAFFYISFGFVVIIIITKIVL